jgi:hypothetical protein
VVRSNRTRKQPSSTPDCARGTMRAARAAALRQAGSTAPMHLGIGADAMRPGPQPIIAFTQIASCWPSSQWLQETTPGSWGRTTAVGVAAGAAFTGGTAPNAPSSIAAKHIRRRKQGAEENSNTGGSCEQACNSLLANQRLVVKMVETSAELICPNMNIRRY